MAFLITKASLVLPAALLALGACSVGEVNGPAATPDAAEGPDAPPPIDAPPLASTICSPAGIAGEAHIHTDAPANDRRGLGCMDAGCHANGGTGPLFTMAGTAYQTSTGVPGLPQAGSIVRVFAMDGNTLITQAVTDAAGNFRSTDPIPTGTYLTNITECGVTPLDLRPMSAVVSSALGDMNCSRANCHGSVVQPRIFLTGP